MTWRAISARPYLAGGFIAAADLLQLVIFVVVLVALVAVVIARLPGRRAGQMLPATSTHFEPSCLGLNGVL